MHYSPQVLQSSFAQKKIERRVIRTKRFYTLGPQMTATGLYSGKKSIDRKAQALNNTRIRKGNRGQSTEYIYVFLICFHLVAILHLYIRISSKSGWSKII
jgi:hypothetical protein